MSRLLYTLALVLGAPLFTLHLLWRSRRQPEYRQHWGERWGFAYQSAPPAQPLIWLHAVSVGETRAAEPLIAALRAAWPDHALLVTHMTPTGRATALSTAGVQRSYLPYDYPWAVTRFLRCYRPVLGILLETEVWPNLVAAAQRAGVPLALVNARLSQRSMDKAHRYGGLVRAALQGLAAVLAQTQDDARRLAALGAVHVQVGGNLKFDVAIDARLCALGRKFRDAMGKRAVLLAASTREGEEHLILDALQAARGLPADLLLVLVPRHPQRFDEVAQLVKARGLALARRTELHAALAPGIQVWLGDTMGEMPAYYAAADLAYIGGSLLPLGGQNLIEACVVGCPVLIGPHTFNFTQASEDALRAGAALCVADAPQLMAEAARLLSDLAARLAMGEAGKAFAAAHSGATARTVAALRPLLCKAP